MRKLVLASMLAVFTTAIALPAFIAPQTAEAAVKKKIEKPKKKKPSSKM